MKEFVDLNKEKHERKFFDCGIESVNNFLKTQALRHMKIGVSKTKVLTENTIDKITSKKKIIAFYTISPSSIFKKELSGTDSKKLPHYEKIPVFLIGQLGVDKKYQKQGFGKITLVSALIQLYKINMSDICAFGILIEAENDNVINFYHKFGFQILFKTETKTTLFLPMKTVEQLLKY